MGALKDQNQWFNRNLVSLKLILFFFFAGLANLHVLNTLQPLVLGLNFKEYRLINIIVPLVSTIGPLVAGLLADRFAAQNTNTFGKSLRYLTAIFLLLGAILYGCIYSIPSVERFEARRPLVSFGCDKNGAIIFQERCTEERTCFHWKREKYGSLILTNCSYTCQNPTQFESLYLPWSKGSPLPPTETSSESDYDIYDDSSSILTSYGRRKRDISLSLSSPSSSNENIQENLSNNLRYKRNTQIPPKVYVEPPHLCTKKENNNGNEIIDKCHVYTDDTKSLTVQAILRSATNKENDTHSADWCNYPLDGFQCNVPKAQADWMSLYMNTSHCKPMVECEVIDPYDSPGSVLAESQCIKVIGDLDKTYWGYFILRMIAEIFPLAALTLINTTVIIATRETSSGRSEICKQFVWGAIGWILLYPRISQFAYNTKSYEDYILIMLLIVIICFILSAIILIFSTNIPLSPPEWWWHTKSGMLVYPMSAIRRYGPEIFALIIITIILGTFWSSINSYLPWSYVDYNWITCLALIPILLLFFDVDKFIEQCGHSNILIGGFAIYIIRFTALTIIDENPWLTILMEILEPLLFGLIWFTIIIYMRHIMLRKFTATGQAGVIIAHFCLGKSFGAIIGYAINEKQPSTIIYMYNSLAITACVISLIYFILYHGILAPRFAAKTQSLPTPDTNLLEQTSIGSAATQPTNGNYTPLRIYHNERGKKGQFRY